LTVQAQSSTDAKLRALVVLGVMLAVAITAGLTLLLTGNLFVRDARDRPRRGVSFATAGSAMLLANLYPAIAGFPLAAIVGIAMGFCYPALPIAVPMMVRRYRRTRRKSKGAPREP
jgi:hypothetical protein